MSTQTMSFTQIKVTTTKKGTKKMKHTKEIEAANKFEQRLGEYVTAVMAYRALPGDAEGTEEYQQTEAVMGRAYDKVVSAAHKMAHA